MVLEYRKRSGIAMNEVIIQAQDLVKIYKSKKGIFSSRKEEVKALDHVSFEIKKGQIVGLIGESGCGKTTVLKMINKLIKVSKGKILVNDMDISQENEIDLRRNIGYVIQ